MEIKPVSANSIIIYFSNTISKESAKKVKNAYENLLRENIKGLIEIVPSYTSILINYDIFIYDFDTLKNILEKILAKTYESKESENIINIDVYYGSEVGLDLERIAKIKNISIAEIIKIHSQKLYDVYAIGFLPAFAYLGNVDERIATSRLDSPRKEISKGSVAIADTQTAIYPQQSPGGWNIIGKTAKELFDKSLDNLCPLKVGDKVKFNPISKDEFLAQGGVS
ncbi:MAG: 5-oxoprolinase subunit PxpB [Arcobacter sp.]|nr:5-oxoprolinase subunit PxpB [Arcobacter sp.]